MDRLNLAAVLVAALGVNGIGCHQTTCEEEATCGGTPDLTEGDGGLTEGGVGEGGLTDSGAGDTLLAEGSGEGGACDGTKSPAEQPCLVTNDFGVFLAPLRKGLRRPSRTESVSTSAPAAAPRQISPYR